MNARLNIFIIVVFLLFVTSLCQAQETKTEGYLVPMCVYEGDTIPYIKIPTVYIFKPLKFKNKKQLNEYNRLVYNVKQEMPMNHIPKDFFSYLPPPPSGTPPPGRRRIEIVLFSILFITVPI